MALGPKNRGFSGDWAIKLGGRVFIVVSLEANPGAQPTTEVPLARPQHFSTAGGASFSGITGPPIRLLIVKSTVQENRLLFTTQNPTDASDKDDFQLCVLDEGRGTLKFDVPGLDPWPLSKEMGPVVVFQHGESPDECLSRSPAVHF